MNALSSKDLQELISANIISEEKALEIETYFNNKKNGATSKLNMVFGVLSALFSKDNLKAGKELFAVLENDSTGFAKIRGISLTQPPINTDLVKANCDYAL